MPSIDWTLVQYRAVVDDEDEHGSCRDDEGDQPEPDSTASKKAEPAHPHLQCHIEDGDRSSHDPQGTLLDFANQLFWNVSILPPRNLVKSRQPRVIMQRGTVGQRFWCARRGRPLGDLSVDARNARGPRRCSHPPLVRKR